MNKSLFAVGIFLALCLAVSAMIAVPAMAVQFDINSKDCKGLKGEEKRECKAIEKCNNFKNAAKREACLAKLHR